MSVKISNHCKIVFLGGHFLFTHSDILLRGVSFSRLPTVLSVTDRQTDGRTDRHTDRRHYHANSWSYWDDRLKCSMAQQYFGVTFLLHLDKLILIRLFWFTSYTCFSASSSSSSLFLSFSLTHYGSFLHYFTLASNRTLVLSTFNPSHQDIQLPPQINLQDCFLFCFHARPIFFLISFIRQFSVWLSASCYQS